MLAEFHVVAAGSHYTVARKFSIGVLYVCSVGLGILKIDKNSTDLLCFIIQFGGLRD